ncbi:Predicted acetyltransferase, GNAT superfamily [Cryobacterium flavum]|uniref:Chorismate synthase n=1 Tax=Cryobacterium flavum TaxID=1424659 RepID=A0A4R8VCZ4_9MICO|nr:MULTISPECIES: chorismate synthase [Cryobacterium]TFB81204.1 chorismate synthase [Cryobacterium flavum]TFD05490.1 chorismate synthase [Cryobacterium sp. TMT1-66-1]TFD10957.1 chorismate synthase [Cryobacterium sp. TMT1-2-2]SDM70771.1 Predicted acetyltransferase, GNAT superfamily [Cryobacterium flavum]
MSPSLTLAAVTEQAQGAARVAAESAGVRVSDENSLAGFLEIEALFNRVWLLPPGESAIPSELLRSISHAGCNVTAARDPAGRLVGAAAAIVTPQSTSMYSLIAGVLPGISDRGVGFALKQHQRAWGLARDLTEMTWTFDPLVSRNARFNLTKLGAYASGYAVDFYGPMQGEMNANDESDRLVAVWPLTSDESAACSEDRPIAVERPDFAPNDVLKLGPDGDPVLVAADGDLWCRVPADIVALRGQNPQLAAEWRRSIRSIFTDIFASGHIARGVSRDGWYRLPPGGTA